MSSLLADFKFALRDLAKAPAFTVAAVLVLALCIGLNTAMFSAVYALAFSPRAFPAPDRLVQLHTEDKRSRPTSARFPTPPTANCGSAAISSAQHS